MKNPFSSKMLISHKISRKWKKYADNFVQHKNLYISRTKGDSFNFIPPSWYNRRKKIQKSKKSNFSRPSRSGNVIFGVSRLFSILFHILVGSIHLRRILVNFQKIYFFDLFDFFQNFLGKRSKSLIFCSIFHQTAHAEYF